jgi:hypothetical protein
LRRYEEDDDEDDDEVDDEDDEEESEEDSQDEGKPFMAKKPAAKAAPSPFKAGIAPISSSAAAASVTLIPTSTSEYSTPQSSSGTSPATRRRQHPASSSVSSTGVLNHAKRTRAKHASSLWFGFCFGLDSLLGVSLEGPMSF